MGSEALKNGGKPASYDRSRDMVHEHAPVNDTDIGVVGLLASSALTAMMRFAKDGDQTLNVRAYIEHAYMSARALELLEQPETQAGHRDYNLHETAGRYSDLCGGLGARTKPSTWSGRSVETYATLGIIEDLLYEASEHHGLFNTSPDVWDLNRRDQERDHLMPQIGEDPQLTARLSLQVRRIAGGVLGLIRAILSTHLALAREPGAAGEIATLVTKCHGGRIVRINPKA